MGKTTRRIKQVKVSVFHHDCGISEPSERNSEVSIEQASPISTLKKTRKGGIYELLWRVRAPDREALERYLKGFKSHKTTAEMDVLEKHNSDALLLWRTRPMTSTYNTILDRHIIHSSSVVAQGGYEVHNVLSTNPNDLKKMLEELSEIGEVKVLRIGDFALGTSDQKFKITKKQQDALGTALAHGYYQWPRKVTIEELALASNVSRRSFHDRLRRAEANVFPLLVKDLLKKQEQRP
jgi:predicted DNA binding protein